MEVVQPSPAISLVLAPACLTSFTPRFSNGSSNSIFKNIIRLICSGLESCVTCSGKNDKQAHTVVSETDNNSKMHFPTYVTSLLQNNEHTKKGSTIAVK